MAATRELLREAPLTYLDIYAATGIAPDWLTKFANGGITDPGVNRVESLYSFLSGSELKV